MIPATQFVDAWTPQVSAADSEWSGVCWSEELALFVAVARSGPVAVMTSPDGITWTARPGPGDAASTFGWNDVIWVADLALFVAVSGDTYVGGVLYSAMTSPDGITWTLHVTPGRHYYRVVWAAALGLLVAVGESLPMTSPDGVTWTLQTAPVTGSWTGLAWSSALGRLVAVMTNALTNGVMTSMDGVTWTIQAAQTGAVAVAWSDELSIFVAGYRPPGAATELMASADGLTWTDAGGTIAPGDIIWSPGLGLFLAIKRSFDATAGMMASPDGITWTTHEPPLGNTSGIAWSPSRGYAVIVRDAGTGNRVMTSQSCGNRADWLAWPMRSIAAAVVLQPNLVLSGWTAVGGGAPNTYSTPLSRFILTDAIAGGIYQQCVGLNQNGTALTEKTSLATVDATAGSWWWDEANSLLYAHSTTGSDPDTFTIYFAQVKLYVSNDGRVINRTDGRSSTGVPFRPWLPGELPSVSREVEDFFFGQKISATTALKVLNTSFAFYRLLANDSSYWWKNTPVRIYLGGDYNGRTLQWSQYLEYLTMLVEDAACDDLAAAFQLKPLARLLGLDLPPTPYFESSFPNLGEGVRGKRIPIGYGRAIRRPDLTDTTASYGKWTIADAAYQTLFAVNAVVAISKTDGSRTTLTLTTHYTVDLTACTVTIVHATYTYTAYDIEVDVTGKPDGVGGYLKTVGEISRDLLETFLDAGTVDLDTAAFAQADLDATAELSIWLPDTTDGGARTLGSIFSSNAPDLASIEGSVFATLKQNRAGQWTIKVWEPGYDASTVVTLNDEDFVTFSPAPKLETIYPESRVYYARNHSTGAWSVASASDAGVGYLSKSTDVLERRTYLRSSGDATVQAQRALFMSGAQSQEVEFVLRTSKLAESIEGDKVLVNRTRAMSAAGMWENKLCELLRIDLSPMLEIAGRLTDDRGIGAIVGHWKDSAAPDYSSATDEEKALAGFWSDSSGYIVAGDPTTLNRSVWW